MSEGHGGADVLASDAGVGTFVFKSSQASGDRVKDFATGDVLQFQGFRTAAQGAYIARIGVTNQWTVRSGLDGHN